MAGSGQYPDLRNHALPRPLFRPQSRSRVYPAVLLKEPHRIFGGGDRCDRNRDGKDQLFEIVIIDKEPEWAIKM